MIKERHILQSLTNHLDKKEYSLLIGARQVGKTTLIQKMFTDLRNSTENVHFISLEDLNILRDLNQDFENLFRYATRPANPLLNPEPKRVIVFIDEIQYLEKPSHFLKYMFDTYQQNLKIVATGSSAFYIDSKFKDSLAGRKRIFHLRSLNFSEFLLFKEADLLRQELVKIRQATEYVSRFYNDLLHYFHEYLTFGGYPRVVLENDENEKKLYLDELVTSFLKKDIYESRIEQEQKFYHLCTLLAAQIGSLVNKNELANTLFLNLRTIDKYLYVLQKCFYIDLLPPFYKNIRKEITRMPKIYFHDFGIRNKLLNRFYDLPVREDKGNLLENYVYIRLLELYDKGQIKFWRTADKNEVDFVVSESFSQGFAYEVKSSDSSFKPVSFQKFTNAYPEYPLKCVAYEVKSTGIPILKF